MTSKSGHHHKSASGTPRQEKGSKPVLTETETPLDFSWYAIASLADIENEEPRPLLKKKVKKVPVKVKVMNEDGEEVEEEQERYPSSCIKLNNNCLEDISDMINILDKVVVNPAAITFVSLAMNELKKIDACLCDLPGLKMLFLEGNHISDLSEVEKLGGCPQLVKLALHGNPMETTKDYR